ncbi:hypothetical protein ABW19_dt0204250 [Dactylella cylindrospora]|nr:hypothetical protein ABW19_dt0204250 [Dactylella cylindrospora]
MEQCFARATDLDSDDEGPELSGLSRSVSMRSSVGGSGGTTANISSDGGMRRFQSLSNRSKRATQVKERYLEVNDGIWDTVEEVFIPNAWPVGNIKTVVKKPTRLMW